jgi:RecA-family ATPase
MNKNTVKASLFQDYLSVEKLFSLDLEVDRFFIDGLLPVGSLCLLSSRPKAGKTNLALQMATCLASGKLFLNLRAYQSKVLFISLELNRKQMRKRLKKVLDYYGIDDVSFKKFPLVLRFSGERRGIDALKEEFQILRDKYNITFDVIFIDTYVLFKDINKEAIQKHKSVYEIESEYLAELRKFCEDNDLSIILIYHNRKAQMFSGDITENIMGSTGIAGAVNEIFLLERKTGQDKGKLIITGHTVEEKEFELVFRNGLFSLLTEDEKTTRLAEKIIEYLSQVKSATQTEIFNFLKSEGETSRKGDVLDVLSKYEDVYWKSKREKRNRGKPIVIYSLVENYIEPPKQIKISDFNDGKSLDLDELEYLEELIDEDGIDF